MESHTKNCALQLQYNNIQDMLNVDAIFEYMCTKHMLDSHDMERLSKKYSTSKKKIDIIFKILMNKSDLWDDWLWCLYESSTKHGLSAHRNTG